MHRRLKSLIFSRCGSAAVEMALVTPILITLMFGSFELGNYFMDNHVVAKAVRDGARFAARQSFTSYPACSGSPNDPALTQIKNVVRTGQVGSGGSARLPGWTDPNTISVTVSCNTTGNGGAAFSGIYSGMTSGAPVVTVSADVPYTSLFSTVGFSSASLTLHGTSQAAVMGI